MLSGGSVSVENGAEGGSVGGNGRGLVGWVFGCVGVVINMLCGRAGYYNRYLGVDAVCVEEARQVGLCKPFGIAVLRDENGKYRVRIFTTRKVSEMVKTAELTILIEDYGTAPPRPSLLATVPRKWAVTAMGRYFKIAYIYRGKPVTSFVVNATVLTIYEKRFKCQTYQHCREIQTKIYTERDNDIARAIFDAADELPRDKWFISLTTVISKPKPSGTRTLVARVVAIDRETIWTITKTAINILTKYTNLPAPVREAYSMKETSLPVAYKIICDAFRTYFLEGKTETTVTVERYGKPLEALVKLDPYHGKEIPMMITLKYGDKVETVQLVGYLGKVHEAGTVDKEPDPIILHRARNWARRGAAKHWKRSAVGITTLAILVPTQEKWLIYPISIKVDELYALADKIDRLVEGKPLQKVNLDKLIETIKSAETKIYSGVLPTGVYVDFLYAVHKGQKIPILSIYWLLDGPPIGTSKVEDYRRLIGLATAIAYAKDRIGYHIIGDIEEVTELTLYEYRKLVWLLLLSSIAVALDRDRVVTGIGIENNHLSMYVFLDDESIDAIRSKLINYYIFDIRREVEEGKTILTVSLLGRRKLKDTKMTFTLSNLTMKYFMVYGNVDTYIKKSLQAPLAYRYYLVRLDPALEIQDNTVAFPRIPQVLKKDVNLIVANYGLALTTKEEVEKLWELFRPF